MQALDERRLRLEVDYHGRILSASTGTPTSLFNVTASDLPGRPVFHVLDFLQQASGETPHTPCFKNREPMRVQDSSYVLPHHCSGVLHLLCRQRRSS
jgi:hypothetical protein